MLNLINENMPRKLLTQETQNAGAKYKLFLIIYLFIWLWSIFVSSSCFASFLFKLICNLIEDLGTSLPQNHSPVSFQTNHCLIYIFYHEIVFLKYRL